MTVLVTGATGFVGAAVARLLLRRGRSVRVLARPGGDRRNLAGLDVEVAEGDLTRVDSLSRAIAGCDGLFHVAADYRLWTPDPRTMFAANVDGTYQLMLAALDARVSRIVYTSSVATLGIPADGPGDEETSVGFEDMIGPYKQSKYRAEELVRRMVSEEGLPAVIVNPSTPLGPRDIKPTPTGRMIVQAATGGMPAYVDTGLNVVHVDDVAEGHLLAYESGRLGRRYVLGSEDMSLKRILEEVARATSRKAPRWRLPHGVVLPMAYAAEAVTRLVGRGEPFVTVDGARLARKHMYFRSDRARDELGYQPRRAAEAIGDAVAWFRDNGYLT